MRQTKKNEALVHFVTRNSTNRCTRAMTLGQISLSRIAEVSLRSKNSVSNYFFLMVSIKFLA